MATPKRPASLNAIADAIGFNPAADPQGYYRLLGGRYDARTAGQRGTEDAAAARAPGGPDGGQLAASAFNRNQSDAAMGPNGFNRSWVPFFESQNLQADINPGTAFKTNFGGLAPAASAADTSYGFPDLATNPQMRQAQAAPSLRALRRQGGN